MRKKIGVFSAQLIEILELNIPAGAPIYIADSNIEHMKTFHPDDFAQYGSELSTIIANPDYVKKNAKDDSIEFTKEYYINGEYVKVAVRISTHNIYYARSMYVLTAAKIHVAHNKNTTISTLLRRTNSPQYD